MDIIDWKGIYDVEKRKRIKELTKLRNEYAGQTFRDQKGHKRGRTIG